jgi:hypothetical protein
MEAPFLFLYVLVKYVAYAAWCCLGVRIAGSKRSNEVLRIGMAWGGLRLVMGIVLGVLIQYLAEELYFMNPRPTSIYIYLIAYVPIRVFEWWILLALIYRSKVRRDAEPWTIGWRVGWIVGGIFISCLADIPVFCALGGFPVGRFWC